MLKHGTGGHLHKGYDTISGLRIPPLTISQWKTRFSIHNFDLGYFQET